MAYRIGDEWDGTTDEWPGTAPKIMLYELPWKPGDYVWACNVCNATGNITPNMITIPTKEWHNCERK